VRGAGAGRAAGRCPPPRCPGRRAAPSVAGRFVSKPGALRSSGDRAERCWEGSPRPRCADHPGRTGGWEGVPSPDPPRGQRRAGPRSPAGTPSPSARSQGCAGCRRVAAWGRGWSGFCWPWRAGGFPATGLSPARRGCCRGHLSPHRRGSCLRREGGRGGCAAGDLRTPEARFATRAGKTRGCLWSPPSMETSLGTQKDSAVPGAPSGSELLPHVVGEMRM